MALMATGITGCCTGQNFYNLGGAHGHARAKNQEEFNLWLAQRQHSGINIAVTNYEQSVERKYLEGAGFKGQKVGELYIHTISGLDLGRQKNEWALAKAKADKEIRDRIAAGNGSKFSPKYRSKPVTAPAPRPIPGRPLNQAGAVNGPAIYGGHVTFDVVQRIMPVDYARLGRVEQQQVVDNLNRRYPGAAVTRNDLTWRNADEMRRLISARITRRRQELGLGYRY